MVAKISPLPFWVQLLASSSSSSSSSALVSPLLNEGLSQLFPGCQFCATLCQAIHANFSISSLNFISGLFFTSFLVKRVSQLVSLFIYCRSVLLHVLPTPISVVWYYLSPYSLFLFQWIGSLRCYAPSLTMSNCFGCYTDTLNLKVN